MSDRYRKHPSSKSRSASWLGLALSVGLAASTSACNHTEAAPLATRAKPIHVEHIDVREQEMPQSVLVAGSLKANQESELAANASGRVTRTMVERGTYVGRGQAIAQLDMRLASLSAGEASANLETARAQKQLADEECKRYEGLLAKGALSQQEYDRQSSNCKTASSAAQAALSRADSAQQTVSDSTVRAPFAGLVAERYVSVGEYVRPDSKVAHIVDIDPLRLEMTIPEQNLSAVKQGQDVSFVVGAFPNQVFHGVVHYIGPAVRAQTRDLVFEALVDNKNKLLRPGLFATARLDAGMKKLPVVPTSALRVDGDTTRLFVIIAREARGGGEARSASLNEGGTGTSTHYIEERVVQVGPEQKGIVAVLNGAKAGEVVVDHPPANLNDGQDVE